MRPHQTPAHSPVLTPNPPQPGPPTAHHHGHRRCTDRRATPPPPLLPAASQRPAGSSTTAAQPRWPQLAASTNTASSAGHRHTARPARSASQSLSCNQTWNSQNNDEATNNHQPDLEPKPHREPAKEIRQSTNDKPIPNRHTPLAGTPHPPIPTTTDRKSVV